MGVDYTAKAVIGLRVFKDELYKQQTVKTFAHHYEEDTDVRFCPKTGRPLFALKNVPIPEYQEDESLAGFAVHTLGYCGEADYILVGHGIESDGEPDMIDIEGINEMRVDMKAKLEPLGLWDEEEFGLWAGLYAG